MTGCTGGTAARGRVQYWGFPIQEQLIHKLRHKSKTPDFADTQANLQQTANAGKGMPAKTPPPGQARVNRVQAPHDASVEAGLAMDQSTSMTARRLDPAIEQARRDVDRGLQDTSKSTELNRAYGKLKK